MDTGAAAGHGAEKQRRTPEPSEGGGESKVAATKEAVVEKVKTAIADKTDPVVTKAKEVVTAKVGDVIEAVASKVSDKLPGDTEAKKDAVVAQAKEAVATKVEEVGQAVASKVSEKLPGGGPEAEEPQTAKTDRVEVEAGQFHAATRAVPVSAPQELRETAEDLREEGQPIVARAAEVEADKMEKGP
jgi:hypothetical protein